MAENYILDNENYTEEEVLQAAKAKGLTVEDYIQQYYPDTEKVEEQEPGIKTLEEGERGRAYGSPTAGLESAFVKLKGLTSSGLRIVDDIVDIGEFGAKMNNPATRSIYFAQQAALRSSDASAEEKQKIAKAIKQNDIFNIVDLDPIAESIEKTLPVYTNDKGEKLDFLGLINEGRYVDAADSFTTEAAMALPSLLVSMVPGGYFMPL